MSFSPERPEWGSVQNWATSRGTTGLLVLLLVLMLPLFLRMPLTADTALYDLQARTVLEGGTLYADVFEPNLPGVVWLHLLVRSAFGWSSEVLRLFDLLCFGGAMWLLQIFALPTKNLTTKTLFWFTTLLFYFSLSEWCHCQRDVWMLLPVSGALCLRKFRVLQSQKGNFDLGRFAEWGLLEGFLWGLAFWIKPHIVVPIVCVLIATGFLFRQVVPSLFDAGAMLCGGLLAGLAGTIWLIQHGAWDAFWEIQTAWNPEYLAASKSRWSLERLGSVATRFFPWILVHGVAVPLAVKSLRWRIVYKRPYVGSAITAQVLLAAVYLGWLFQSLFLQHLLDYVHVPAIVLAIAMIGSAMQSANDVRLRHRLMKPTPEFGLAAATFLTIALLASPLASPRRMAQWPTCFTATGSDALVLKNKLRQVPIPDWQHLGNVAQYLKQQNVSDGELTCYGVHLVHLHQLAEAMPSTRYVFLDVLLRLFPSRHETIRGALEDSEQRYVVCNLIECGLDPKSANQFDESNPNSLPPGFPDEMRGTFPWTQPVVYRSGPYVVHEVTEPLGELTGAFMPLGDSSD